MSATTIEPGLHGDISNAGEDAILLDAPYRVLVKVTGTSPILFHRWQTDEVETKAKAAKNSAAKKTDNIESYVWRNQDAQICLPGVYLLGSLIDPRNGAAKYLADPRSPRKSALDLFRAGVVPVTDLAPIVKSDGTIATVWDFVDRRRATVQRAGITRSRPGFDAGWSAEVVLQVLSPEYISSIMLQTALTQAGRLVGTGDFRPTFGRFAISHFEVLQD